MKRVLFIVVCISLSAVIFAQSEQFEGIGAQLILSDGYAKVQMLVPGSPSWLQGELKENDLITMIKQENEAKAVNIHGMSLDEIVMLVRGKKDTKVTLTVRRGGGTTHEITITRNVIDYAKLSQEFQDNILIFLKDRDYLTEVNENRIKFTKKDDNTLHAIDFSREFPFYVFVQRSGYRLEGQNSLNRSKAISACNEVNKSENVVKVYLDDDGLVVFCIQHYINDEEDFKHVLLRKYMPLLAETGKAFDKEYKKL